jgi:hypothetical protein
MTNNFSGLHYLSNEALSAMVKGVRNNPPQGWPTCRIYDTQLSYAACQLLGRRRTLGFGQKFA